MISNLRSWMAPEAAGPNSLLVPCTAEIRREPFGVCLIMGSVRSSPTCAQCKLKFWKKGGGVVNCCSTSMLEACAAMRLCLVTERPRRECCLCTRPPRRPFSVRRIKLPPPQPIH